MTVVRQSLMHYRSGRADAASRAWDDDIAWTIRGTATFPAEWNGHEAVFAYHARLAELSDGTFRQQLVALEGSRASTVAAYLRTTARRAGRSLDIPTLAVFELAAGRIRRVTELPGDLAAWESFWAD
jgi:ketosteroid isomerase-like protein